MTGGRHPSAGRLREKLAANGEARRMYQGDALYNVQIDWTCRLLDMVDEVADPVTARRITDLIGEQLAGDGVSEAAQRQRAAMAEADRLMHLPTPSRGASRLDILKAPAAGRDSGPGDPGALYMIES